MAQRLGMEPEQLRQTANNFKREAGDIDRAINNLKRMTSSLQDVWEGDAVNKFEDQFRQLEPSFKKMVTLIGETAQQLNNTATSTEQFEREIASKFGVK